MLPSNEKPSNRAQALNEMCEEIGLVDVWRALHPRDREYKFFSGVHKTASRIDYFFSPKTSLQNVIDCNVGNIVISDHAPVFLRLGLSNQIYYLSSWKFKPWLIHDPNFKSYLKEQVKLFIMDNRTPEVSPNLLWDTAKAYIRRLIISYVSNQKKSSWQIREN